MHNCPRKYERFKILLKNISVSAPHCKKSSRKSLSSWTYDTGPVYQGVRVSDIPGDNFSINIEIFQQIFTNVELFWQHFPRLALTTICSTVQLKVVTRPILIIISQYRNLGSFWRRSFGEGSFNSLSWKRKYFDKISIRFQKITFFSTCNGPLSI